MTYSLQFVDSISATATVRLDLMTSNWIVRDTTTFGQPELRRSAVSSLLADGETYPAAAYGNRLITLVMQMADATDEDGAATALQRLYRELDRPKNFLLYRPDTTAPVFFRTFRAAPSSVDWDPALKRVTAQIPAEPFAYGLKETVGTTTVNNDPAAGSNGMFFDVSSPKGDVETPLFLSVPGTSAASGRRMSAIAVRRRGTPSAVPFVLQAETMTASTDTSLQANDVTMSGAGSNFVRCTFSTAPAMNTRLTVTPFPSSPSVDVRGTYRVFARVRKSVSGDVITMRLDVSADGATITGDTVTLPSGTAIRWVDISGQFPLQFPAGYDPVEDGYSGTTLQARGQNLFLNAARAVGSTGNLDVDALLFVPADDRFCLVKWPEFTGPTAFVLDSAAEAVFALGASGEVRTAVPCPIAGLPPMVTPGVTNRVFFVLDVGSTTAGDAITTTVAVTSYYWPRYLAVRPVAS